MKIIMAGIDYQRAHIDLRERVSFTKNKVREIIKNIHDHYHVGVVLLCTCNRTEIYISYQFDKINPVELICQAAGVEPEEFSDYFYIKENREAIGHLMEVTCGIHSMIFGEDQILTQIKEAIESSKEEHVSDSVLNTVFRYAITCGKKVKTEVTLRAVSPSVTHQAVEILREILETHEKKTALVIGNGQVGRSICNELIHEGCEVYMTLRSYKHGEAIIPTGCIPIEYEERREYISKVDIVISATLSPHHTITYEMVESSLKKPLYVIDLAVPRDIDPLVGTINGIRYYNIDTIGESARQDHQKEIEKVKIIIEEQMIKYEKWFIVHQRSSFQSKFTRLREISV